MKSYPDYQYVGLLHFKLSHLDIPEIYENSDINLSFALEKVEGYFKSIFEKYIGREYYENLIIESVYK